MDITWCFPCASTSYVFIPYTSVRFRPISVELFSVGVFLFQFRAVRLSCRSGKRRSQTGRGFSPFAPYLPCARAFRENASTTQDKSEDRTYLHSLTYWPARQRKNGEAMNHPRHRKRVVSTLSDRDRLIICINVQNSCNWFTGCTLERSGLPVGGSLPPQPANFNPQYYAN